MLVGWVHVWPKASTIETFIEYIQFGFAWGGWQGLQDLQACEPPLCANWWVKMSRAPKEPDCLEPDRDTTHLSSQKDQLKDCCLTVSIHLFWTRLWTICSWNGVMKIAQVGTLMYWGVGTFISIWAASKTKTWLFYSAPIINRWLSQSIWFAGHVWASSRWRKHLALCYSLTLCWIWCV